MVYPLLYYLKTFVIPSFWYHYTFVLISLYLFVLFSLDSKHVFYHMLMVSLTMFSLLGTQKRYREEQEANWVLFIAGKFVKGEEKQGDVAFGKPLKIKQHDTSEVFLHWRLWEQSLEGRDRNEDGWEKSKKDERKEAEEEVESKEKEEKMSRKFIRLRIEGGGWVQCKRGE